MKVNGNSASFTALLGSISALSALSVDISLPALPAMTASLAAEGAAAQLTLSFFVLGFAGGQLFLGPLSDRFGRRPILLCGLAVYVLAGVACALAPTIGFLTFMRFIQGLSACSGQVIVRAVIRDMFERPAAAAKQSVMTVVTTLAMLVAPIVGAWVLQFADWRSVFALLPLCGAVVLAWTVIVLPETRPEQVEPLPNPLRSYLCVLREPVTLGNAFVVACIFAGLFVFISDSSIVFIKHEGVSPQTFSWMFAIVALGQLGGSTLNRMLAMRIAPVRLVKVGGSLAFIATSLVALLALFPFGHTAVLLAVALYAFSLGMTNPNAVAAAMVPLPQNAGAASAVIGCLQFVMGSCAAALAGYFLPGTIGGMLAIMACFGFSGVGFLVWLEFRQARLLRSSPCSQNMV